jgi:hypothetical protein
MARSNITSRSKDLITDDGSVIVSVVQGEQTRINVTLGWLTNLTGYTLTAKVVEGENSQGTGAVPTDPLTGGSVQTLTILDSTVTDNIFEIVIPETLIDTWVTTPEPDQPIYGYLELEVADIGVGVEKLIWKPLRGLVQVRYSPTEAV